MWSVCTWIRPNGFNKFLNHLDREVPDDLDVHLILDNYSTHKTPQIKRWLVRHPRFVLHFTPTSSSWLNLVERWFGAITTKKLQRCAHRSVTRLNADIVAWAEAWNADPKPFVSPPGTPASGKPGWGLLPTIWGEGRGAQRR